MRLSGRLAVLGAAAVAATALTTYPAAAATPWSRSYGTATAAGTTEFVSDGRLGGTTTVSGELTNTGADCYSIWVQYIYDLVPGPVVKHVTQCGAGSAPINIKWTSTFLTPTQRMYVRLCKGQEKATDCAAPLIP
ncbi:hypothetical protein [Nonomuraea sp. NPDC050786]|uniref:hypothetical protein n=1 Tax=Nonomuraea sp. NPDC050786 TaxID=3154840 RepID=UPI0033C0ADA1